MPPFAALVAVALAADAPPLDRPALAAAVADALDKHGAGVQAGVWLGGAAGPAWFDRDPDAVRPTASAIKAFYLVELFDRFKDKLDGPVPGADAALTDDHPAVSHFPPKQRADIRTALAGATVRHLGRVMIGTDDEPNHVYNAAANVVTAVLGGPEPLTALIRKRDKAFAPVAARRYMLRDRKTPGDNEATAAALAALWQKLAAGTVPGMDARTLAAVRDALRWQADKKLGTRYSKEGFLGSDPMTAVRAGWWQTPAGPVVYVVMAEQPSPGDKPRAEAGEALGKTAGRIEALVVAAGRKAAARPRE
jgi:hypothetical protein